MDEHRFDELAGAYGADIDRWPLRERDAARAWAAAAPDARHILAQARRLDLWLAADVTPPPSPDLQRRVSTKLLSHHRRPLWLGWRAAVSALATFAAGTAIGVTLVVATPRGTPLDAEGTGQGGIYEQSSFGDLGALVGEPSPSEGS